jgi:hypothetical protein
MRTALAVPIVKSVPGEVYPSHLTIAAEIGRAGEFVAVCPLDQFPFDVARNWAFDQAIEQECDYLMFVDSDQRMPPNTFGTLLECLKRRGAVMVTGYYSKRGWPFCSVWGRQKGEGACHVSTKETTGSYKIDVTGLGCALIDLNWVVDNLTKPYFDMPFDEEIGRRVFEDTFFCLKIKKAGGSIWGCMDVSAGHLTGQGEVNRENEDKYRKQWIALGGALEEE